MNISQDPSSLLAHKFGSHLTAIKWTVELLNNGSFGELSPEQKSALTEIEKHNEKMITFLNDLVNKK